MAAVRIKGILSLYGCGDILLANGTDELDNFQFLCRAHNSSKGTKIIGEELLV
jgi:hypothetical protein